MLYEVRNRPCVKLFYKNKLTETVPRPTKAICCYAQFRSDVGIKTFHHRHLMKFRIPKMNPIQYTICS